MSRTSLVQRAHAQIREVLQPGDIAIDCTVGNGHDTVFLSRTVGSQGKVYGFDIQQQALDNSWQRLQELNLETRVSLFHAGHELLSVILPGDIVGKVKAIMFNLGYLPGSDHGRITRPSTTLAALEAALSLLAPGGRISILAYSGHPGGQQESEAVLQWIQLLPRDLYNIIIEKPDQQNSPGATSLPPTLIVIEKNEPQP